MRRTLSSNSRNMIHCRVTTTNSKRNSVLQDRSINVRLSYLLNSWTTSFIRHPISSSLTKIFTLILTRSRILLLKIYQRRIKSRWFSCSSSSCSRISVLRTSMWLHQLKVVKVYRMLAGSKAIPRQILR